MATCLRFLLLLAVLLAAVTTQDASARRGQPRRTKRNRGKNRCFVPGCQRCNATNRNECDVCRVGFAKTEAAQCQACGEGCLDCAKSGASTCDTCKTGFTIDKITQQCARCASHCHKCDEAGPGGCNECGPRRMLHVRLELQGEVHECHKCDAGCRACSEAEGCTECDSFYYLLPNGAGCAFSWTRVFMLLSAILLPIAVCVWALSDEIGEPYQPPPRARKPTDSAKVVRSGMAATDEDAGGELRKRGGRPFGGHASDASPRHAPASRPDAAYPLLQGYSGIEIVDQR